MTSKLHNSLQRGAKYVSQPPPELPPQLRGKLNRCAKVSCPFRHGRRCLGPTLFHGGACVFTWSTGGRCPVFEGEVLGLDPHNLSRPSNVRDVNLLALAKDYQRRILRLPTTRKCATCGREVEMTGSHTTYCQDCAKERRRESKRKHMGRVRSTEHWLVNHAPPLFPFQLRTPRGGQVQGRFQDRASAAQSPRKALLEAKEALGGPARIFGGQKFHKVASSLRHLPRWHLGGVMRPYDHAGLHDKSSPDGSRQRLQHSSIFTFT